MSARTTQPYAITARAQRRMSDTFDTGPIETDEGVHAIGPTTACQQVTRAAQVPFPLFAHRPDEKKRPFGLDGARFKGARRCDERREPAAVIGDARRKKPVLNASHGKVSARRKDRVQMRARDYERRERAPSPERHAIAFLVNLRVPQPMLAKSFGEIACALCFPEGRRGDRAEPYVVSRDFGGARFKKLKSAAHTRAAQQLLHCFVRRNRDRRGRHISSVTSGKWQVTS